jgi:hypothetical protein
MGLSPSLLPMAVQGRADRQKLWGLTVMYPVNPDGKVALPYQMVHMLHRRKADIHQTLFVGCLSGAKSKVR